MLGSASSIEPEHKENEHSSREGMRTLPPPETFLTVPHSSLDGSGPIAARIAARNAARLQAVRDVTFEQCVDELMASHETAWRQPETPRTVARDIGNVCLPHLRQPSGQRDRHAA